MISTIATPYFSISATIGKKRRLALAAPEHTWYRSPEISQKWPEVISAWVENRLGFRAFHVLNYLSLKEYSAERWMF